MQSDQGRTCQVQAPLKVDKVEPLECENVPNCLVYKLVRVEEDGTVVPATEDEVLQVESILEADVGVECSQGVQSSTNLESERKKLLAQLEFLDSVLKKVKDEEHERTVYDGLDIFNNFVQTGTTDGGQIHDMQWHIGSVISECKLESRLENNVPRLDSPSNSAKKSQTSKEQHLQTSTGELESPSSTSRHSWMGSTSKAVTKTKFNKKDASGSSTPEVAHKMELDLFKGEVRLDNLSIRELHEAFQLTFGRPTSVKDKQWLKRRITMGLKSLHENNNVMVGETQANSVGGVSRLDEKPAAEQPIMASVIKEVDEKQNQSPTKKHTLDAKFSDHKKYSCRAHMSMGLRLASPGKEISDSCAIKSQLQESIDMKGKRQRKPTKRYIEELEATETKAGGRSSVVKESDHGKVEIKPEGRISSESGNGQADLGVAALKFTTGYRRHRGRPKKLSNTILRSISTGRAAQLVRKAISARTSRHATKERVSHLKYKRRSLEGQIMHRPCGTESKNHGSNIDQELVPVIYTDSSKRKSLSIAPVLNVDEEYVEIVPTPKGGMRRKHHRPWNLKEVMRLVEGVARCGVGKWAEIKKVAFSNIVYRTSVDLKDKWRNLLRASDSHVQTGKQRCQMVPYSAMRMVYLNSKEDRKGERGEWGFLQLFLPLNEQRRKHAGAPVPGPILLRVRELTALQSHSQSVNLGSGVSRSGRTVHKRHF